MGEPVEFAGHNGYLAVGEGAGPALIVLPEQWGVVKHVEDVCERFAAEGFTALAPAPHPGTPGRSDGSLELERSATDVSGVVDFLQGHPSVRGNGVGVVGFAAGAALALWLGSIRPDRVRAVVPFYGTVPRGTKQPDWKAMTAAVEGHFAESDELVSPEAVRELEDTLVESGHDVRMFLYPGTSPGFFDDTRPDVYDEDAARQAWVRSLEFLRARLG